jgi:hypothetical protein
VPSNDWDAIVAGENVTFELTAAPDDARLYNWYVDGIYLATTTTPEYTSYFSLGSHEMKVELDNCLSLTESNSVSFSTQNVYPTSMPATGDDERWIRIYNGNDASPFPYAATSEYVQDGLVAHFDGINNIGEGDKAHDFNATAWKDLKNNFSIPRGAGAGQWLSNGFQALNGGQSFYNLTFPNTYPVGNASRTVEVIFKTPDSTNMFEMRNGDRRLFLYGSILTGNDGVGKLFGVLYRGATRDVCTDGGGWTFYHIAGNVNNLVSCLSSTPALTTHSTINTVTSTYANSMADTVETNSYINNTKAYIIERGGSLDTDGNGFIFIGENLSYSTFLSVRLYDRVLTLAEIQHNAALDQKRYLAPPVVTIGDNPCTNVTVLSPRCLTCQVPEGTQGTVNVKVFQSDGTTEILTYEDVFTYEP